MADIALTMSDHSVARKNYDDALVIYRDLGDVHGEAHCTFGLADIARERLDASVPVPEQYFRALELYHHAGDVLGEANCRLRLGQTAQVLQELEWAERSVNTALDMYRQIGARLGEATCLQAIGEIRFALHDFDVAARNYELSLVGHQSVGDLLGQANCIRGLADIARERGDIEVAWHGFWQALSLYQQVPEPYSIGWTYYRLAGISDGAERALHTAAARAAWHSIDRPDLVAQCLKLLD